MSGAGAVAGGNGNYRIEVADFGPIRHAAVDLRPLTVFAGPSNTGKSYLAMLVYALHQCFGPSYLAPVRRRRARYWFAGGMAESLLCRAEVAQHFIGWWSTVNQGEPALLSDELAAAIRPVLEQLAGAKGYLEQELRRSFGVDALADLVRQGSCDAGALVTLSIPKELDHDRVRYRFELGSEGVRVSGELGGLPRVPIPSLLFDEKYRPEFADLEDAPFLLRSVLDDMFESLTKPMARPAHYLPADRGGVMHSHQVVVSTLIQSATAAGLRPSVKVPLLSGVLADFLDGLIGMTRPPHTSSRTLADVLEQNLLAGAVRLNRSESGYPSFAYRPANWDSDLPLMRTSSMVSELAPVVLYLRYLVGPGDLLIIEEPESHLHPALQAAFARELARLVHSGVRVMLTTHSEWILEALANLVRLSELPEERREGLPGADVALTPDQVGAWLFKPDSDGAGSAVEEIPLDTEAGSFPAGFAEVTESLYNEWARIANRIEAAKSDQKD